nr:MAG TPA: hypothetical protein [Caudoviricetes sp.]
MNKVYNRINWENQPSTNTALGATNLNKVDLALDTIDNRVLELDNNKLPIEVANTMVKSFGLDETTGVITVTLLNGTVYTWDLNIEKIPINLSLTKEAVLVLYTADGETYTADLKGLIDTYQFDDSDTIGFSMQLDTDGKHVTGTLKNGSVKEKHLDPNYLAEINMQVAKSEGQANLSKDYADLSKRYAVGGVIQEDSEDNAKYYAEQCKKYKDIVQETANINYPNLYIEPTTGHLISVGGSGITFRIENGHLISEVIA